MDNTPRKRSKIIALNEHTSMTVLSINSIIASSLFLGGLKESVGVIFASVYSKGVEQTFMAPLTLAFYGLSPPLAPVRG
ncbi:hypothetical protein TNCV_4246781 [Trichonephila clavipes]|nr:hypothetical protein TNCV_4246781 [Trichonephila clavipes]